MIKYSANYTVSVLTLFLLLFSITGCGGSEDEVENDTDTATEEKNEQVVNVYSSRHYYSDDEIYAAFTEETGIEVNVIEGKADELLARIKQEGELSPADVFISVDAGRLQLAVDAEVLEPVESEVLSDRIPTSMRHPEGLWFGLSKRLRCIYVGKDAPDDMIKTYAELADLKLKGKLLIRSSSNIYNQSLVASRFKIMGEEATEAWCKGIVENMARVPQGGDTDQLRALAAGEGEVAVGNHYYFIRMIVGDKPADQAAAANIRLIFPDQDGRGTHVNVSGAGVIKSAPNKENAIKLIEFIASDKAQKMWALDNYEFPASQTIELSPILAELGEIKLDTLNAAELGINNREAVKVMDRAGWR
ncbi:MAG: Fe(3+) ABC transporter substrate-binding protein [Planctomycetota bacterium]